jgi:hypothetical protein
MIFDSFRSRSFCSGEDTRSQKLFIHDAILINASYALTTGAVLTGYTLYLGASDFLAAFINNAASFSAIICILSFLIFETVTHRKKLLLTMNFTSRTLFMFILIIPLIIKTDDTVAVLITFTIVLSEIIFSIYRVGWLVWMMDTAPIKNKTHYIYMRMFYLRCAFSVVTLASGFVLDLFDKGYKGFVLLFGFSYVLSLLDLFVLSGVRDRKFDLGKKTKGLVKFLEPMKAKKYREFLIFIFIFYFFFSIANAYTPVYMIKYLKFDYRLILSMSVLSMLAMIVSNLFWMKAEKKKGSNFVLTLSALLQAAGLLIIGFMTGRSYFLYYISTMIMGFGSGGFNTTSFTYRFELMPEIGKTIYESWFYLVFGFATLLAPLTGQLFINILPEFTNRFINNSRMQLLYMISFVLLVLSVVYINIRRDKVKAAVI